MKTLAQFKRDAKAGMRLELMTWFRNTGDDIPKRLRGIRRVVSVNTVGVMLMNADGQKSELDVKRASLVEYDGETLKVYRPAIRELTDQEKAVLARGQQIENEYYEKNPYGNAFWTVKKYFMDSPCPWMEGLETVRGKRYCAGDDGVLDNSIKGELILQYKVYNASENVA